VKKYFLTILTFFIFVNPVLGKQIDRIVAKINGDVILASELDENVNSFMLQAQIPGSPDEIRRKILDQMIDEKILLQEARNENIDATDDEIKTALQNLRDKFPTKEDFNRELRKQGLTIIELQANLIKQLKIMKLVEKNVKRKIQVSNKEVDDYYFTHQNQSKEDIKNVIFDKKFNESYSKWMQKIRNDAVVDIKL